MNTRLVSLALSSSVLLTSGIGLASGSNKPLKVAYLTYANSPHQVGFSVAKLHAVSAHVQGLVNAGHVDGATLLVARHGKVVLYNGFGRRDGNWAGNPWLNPPMPYNGIFDLQSVTKLFTAFVALDLVEDGLLDLNAPVGDYLPEFQTGDKAAMTVRDLIRFTSGSNLDTSASLVGDPDPWATMLAEPLAYTPNTMVLYSDLGYRLLGRVAEIAGGASLEHLAKNRIFQPLGMQDTSWRPHLRQPTKGWRFAGTGYSERYGSTVYMRGEVADDQDDWIEQHTGEVTGCDGAFSTAWDLALFGQMFLNRGARIVGNPPGGGFCSSNMKQCHIVQMISPELATAMMTIQTTDENGVGLGFPVSTSSWLDDLLFENKGYGWELASHEPGAHVVTGTRSTIHAVSKIGGAGTFLMVDPDPERDLVVVYLTNKGLPPLTGPNGILVDEHGNISWPGYENMLNSTQPNVVNDLIVDAMTDI